MRRHAKASSAGSTRFQAADLGRFFGGAPAIRVAVRDAKGTGAPSSARLALLFAIAAFALLWISASASAAPPEHPSKGTFSTVAQPTLTNPTGMATDPATGDLYVIDQSDQTLHRYNPDGTPHNFSALAGNTIDGHAGEADEVPGSNSILAAELGSYNEVQVAIAPPGAPGSSEGDIYVTNAEHGEIDVFAPSGAFIAAKTLASYPCGVATDPAGNLYVANREGPGGEGVHKYTPTAPGVFTEAAGSPYLVEFPCQLAAGKGFVYAAQGFAGVQKIDSEGAEEGTIDYEVTSGPGSIAINPKNGHLFVTKPFDTPKRPLDEYDVSGSTEASLVSSTPLASEPHGVAVDSGNDVFLTREGTGKVEVFYFEPETEFFALAITPSGSGSGTVECEVNGGVAEPCEPEYEEGTEVALVASADPGSEFTGFAGDCTGTTCELTMGEDHSVTAGFELEPGQIELIRATNGGTGGGSIECDSGSGFGPCNGSYTENTEISLRAVADSHSVFQSLTVSGTANTTCTGALAECDVKFESPGPLSATAAFGAITVTTVTPGEGPTAGGTSVTVEGTNLTGVDEVKFGANPGTSVTPESATKVKVTSPAGSAGTVDVTVATSGGKSSVANAPADHFTYVAAPSVTNDAPGTITQTSVVLKGHVNNNSAGGGSTCKFVVATEAAPSTPVTEPACNISPVTGNSSEAVEATASGLSPNVKYVYRVVATSVGGTTTGTPDQSAQTLPEAPTVTNDAPGTVTQGSIVLKGHVNNHGAAAGSSCKFVVETAALPHTLVGEPTCTPNPVMGSSSEGVEATISGLSAKTKYVYRVVATNTGGGPITGAPDQETETLPNKPTVTNEAPGTTTQTSIVMKGKVNNRSASLGSECHFVIETAALPHTLVGEPACTPNPVMGNTNFAVEATASGLTANTKYVYRVVATNAGGTTTGTPDQEVQTLPIPTYTLSVSKAGTGSGSITCDGGSCAASYQEGTKVTQAASADSGSSFGGWSGGGCSGTGSCTVTLNANTTVTATFTKNEVAGPPPPPPAAAKCVVPKLKGKTLGQARSTLKAAKCALGKVTKPKKAKGALVVKSTSPAAGANLPAGGKVNLKLAPKPKKHKK